MKCPHRYSAPNRQKPFTDKSYKVFPRTKRQISVLPHRRERKNKVGEFLDICNYPDTEESVSKIEEAKNFLRDYLAENPKTQAEIKTASEQLNIAKRMLNKAKAELHIKSYKYKTNGFGGSKNCKVARWP